MTNFEQKIKHNNGQLTCKMQNLIGYRPWRAILITQAISGVLFSKRTRPMGIFIAKNIGTMLLVLKG